MLKSKKLVSQRMASKVQRFFGSSNHHQVSGSESGSDDHHHHHPHEKPNFFRERRITEPWNTFKHIKSDKYEVLTLIEKLREPLAKTEDKVIPTLKETEEEYIKFLADVFSEHAVKKYPDYKKNLQEFKSNIPNYENLNPYEREVKTLDAYMNWELKKQRNKSYEAQGLNSENDYIVDRLQLLSKLTEENNSDTRILKSIKKKLKKVLESDAKYSKFLSNYNKETESKTISKIIEKRKTGYTEQEFYVSRELKDLKSPQNPYYNPISIVPHDHIKIDNWNSNPDKTDNERHKYLALYDIVIDQHLRRIRPNLEDDTLKYANKNHIQDENTHFDPIQENMYFSHVCRPDGQYFNNFIKEVKEEIKIKEIDDPVKFLFRIVQLINIGRKTKKLLT